NPLAFLAAVGTLRLCDLIWPDCVVRMQWINDAGWRPELDGVPVSGATELCAALAASELWAPLAAFEGLGNNLTVPREQFARTAHEIAASLAPESRRTSDFLAAFGNEVYEDADKGRIVYTDLCFITGSGHQHFLGTARTLQSVVTAEHLSEALFGPWKFEDKSSSFRWNPEDAREYALQWGNPSNDGVMTVWGANRLAFEALPFFPMAPAGTKVRTTGFNTKDGAHEFTWPIWTRPVGADTVRSLAGMRQLQSSRDQHEEQERRRALERMGIGEVFRAQRVQIGQGANFKVSFRPAYAI